MPFSFASTHVMKLTAKARQDKTMARHTIRMLVFVFVLVLVLLLETQFQDGRAGLGGSSTCFLVRVVSKKKCREDIPMLFFFSTEAWEAPFLALSWTCLALFGWSYHSIFVVESYCLGPGLGILLLVLVCWCLCWALKCCICVLVVLVLVLSS
jgi:hypothetical protein